MALLSNLLADQTKLLVPGHSFIVSIGPVIGSFAKVSNIVQQIEYDAVIEGGNDDYPHLFKKPKSKPDTLILEKGVRTRMSDPLFSLLVEGMEVELVTILLLKNQMDLQKAFFFKKGIIIKRQFSNLDAMSNDLFIETLEIAHSGLVEIPIPSPV